MVSLTNNINITDRKINGEAINIGIKISFHNGKSIDWDKCRSDAFDFEIDSVQDGYITIVEPD